MTLRLTAIVPTLNEEASIAATLAGLRASGIEQTLVVDGGSTDSTLEKARPLADQILHETGGLFAQLNAAARQTEGDVLLFHYADVGFPVGGRTGIERAFLTPGVVGGAFSLGFASDRTLYRVIARGANTRNRLGVGPFGDQSIFARADVFRRLGGFRMTAFLEDFDLVRRLKGEGRFVILPEAVTASARRWERNGVARTLLEHWWLTFLYVAGRRGRSRGRVRTAESLRTIR